MNEAAPTPQEWATLARENSVQANELLAIRRALRDACVNLVRPVVLDTSWPIGEPGGESKVDHKAVRRMAARERAWLRSWARE